MLSVTDGILEASMKRPLLIVLLACVVFSASGQARQPVLRITPFTGSGVGASEASMLERLVNSYIAELKAFRVVDAQGQEMALSETETALSLGASTSSALPLTADYILNGTIGKIGDLFIFTLENTRVSSGEKLAVSDTAHTISDIVLRARNTTRTLFGKQDGPVAMAPEIQPADVTVAPSSESPAPAVPAPAVFKAPSLATIVGTWKGDKGLETVRLFPNGTGLAVLSGGGTLKLRITITGDDIVVKQDQPNDVAMYRGASVTLDMARRIVAQARPMRWLFTLSPDGLALSGTKESISISGSGTALKVDNDYVRAAAWARISR